MDDWKPVAVALWWVLVVCVAFWGLGRDNLRLRRSLDRVRADLDRVLADRHELRMRRYDLTHSVSKFARVLRRVWASRRRLQADLALTTRTRDIQTKEYCRVALLARARRTRDQRADAGSLAMCGELARGPALTPAGQDSWAVVAADLARRELGGEA